MTRGYLTPQRVLLAIVMLLLFSSMLKSRHADYLAVAPRWITSRLLGLTTGPLTQLSSWVRGSSPTPIIVPGDQKFEENYLLMQGYVQSLLQEIEQLRQKISDLQQVPETVRRAVDLVPARVIAAPRERHDPVIAINRGTAHGIETNMVVTSGFNLVGLIVSADNTQSQVRLVTAPTINVSVTILSPLAPPGAEGLRAKLRHDRDGHDFRADARKQDPVQVGDLAHLWDQTWPREAAGYVIGQVTQVIDDPDDPILRKIVVIEPRINLAYLTQVYVVVPKEQE